MKRFLQYLMVSLSLVCVSLTTPATAQTGPKTLVLYDAPPGTAYEKLGLAYAIMLRNLLGHFSANVELQPIQQYSAGKLQSYTTTFYLGSYYDNQLPPTFLQEVNTTTNTVVWFKYNIWQLAWDPTYTFTQRYGMTFVGTRGLNAAPTSGNPNPGFFDTIQYKNREFVKYYHYDAGSDAVTADPDIGVMQAADTRPSTVTTVKNRSTTEVQPYVMRSGNFWYFADVPFSYIGPRDRYLVFADLLHDVLGVNHAEDHRGLVRFEDLNALVSVANMRRIQV